MADNTIDNQNVQKINSFKSEKVSNDQVVSPDSQTKTETSPNKPSKIGKLIPIGIGGIFLLFITAFAFSGLIRVKSTPAPEAMPTPTESVVENNPTFIDLYPQATSSAFLSLEDKFSSISAEIKPYDIEDQSLLPPVIELSLGFKEE